MEEFRRKPEIDGKNSSLGFDSQGKVYSPKKGMNHSLEKDKYNELIHYLFKDSIKHSEISML